MPCTAEYTGNALNKQGGSLWVVTYPPVKGGPVKSQEIPFSQALLTMYTEWPQSIIVK